MHTLEKNGYDETLLHFYWGSGPTVEPPDPIDATASPAQVSNTNNDVTVMLVNRHGVRDQTIAVTTIRLASYLASACELDWVWILQGQFSTRAVCPESNMFNNWMR